MHLIFKKTVFLKLSFACTLFFDFIYFLQIDIFYTMSIVGTLSFPGEDMDVNNDTSHFFEAISEIQPTVFFGPPSAFERIYHHFREMKKHTSGTYSPNIAHVRVQF